MTAFNYTSSAAADAASARAISPTRVLEARGPVSSEADLVEIVETGPSIAGQLVALTSRVAIRPLVAMVGHFPRLPVPWSLVDFACGLLPVGRGSQSTPISLPNTTAEVVCASGVPSAEGDRRAVLYLHGGAFLACGTNTHRRIVTALSAFADAPVLVVNYRLIPKHSIGMAVDDCHDAYQWLRTHGYEPDQIVLAGDSAGGYLALTLAQRLRDHGETPAALVAISPLLQLAKGPKQSHPNIETDAIFPAKAFDALEAWVTKAAAKRLVDGRREEVYEPLDQIESGLPPMLVHVSGSEVLLYDAQLAAGKLAAAGVRTELRVWPGQVHVFQLAAPLVPEATRSLRQIGQYIRRATSA
ncbi:alpha/beta hydrolase [Mycobacterium szulgai]|uniref:alpha/beta hydrolase n=1 Tax=Mycobacterium szulgai TaxID=1787 RepID=UPI000A1DDF82|nr:alpha/beta hydrolase [Mycobacterium szulgai]MCV7078131.1 alpha/beta hydrolase [Mycobacterium szulgai]